MSRDLSYWLATPTGSGMSPSYCTSLHETLLHLARDGYRLPRYRTGTAPEIVNLHSMLEQMSRDRRDEVGIFWVGADHSWTPGDFCRILEAAAARPDAVVGAFYPKASGRTLAGMALSDAAGQPAPPAAAGDIREALFLGWGFVFTPFSAFRKMDPPYWEYAFRTQGDKGHFLTPDVAFCLKARDAGVPVLYHSRVVDVGHGQREGDLTARQIMGGTA